MKKIRFTLAMMALVLCSLTVNAHDFEVDGVFYNITDSTELTVEVTYEGELITSDVNCSVYRGDIVIPTTVTQGETTYRVTSIGSSAFYQAKELTSVTISEGLTSIGLGAFTECNLSTITLPESLVTIGEYAFNTCRDLTSITIPKGVKSIKEAAFAQCQSLISVTIPDNSKLTLIGGYAFYDCRSLTSITIPKSVTSIERRAFAKCSKLSNVYCRPEKVPSTAADVFLDSTPKDATLHVPASAWASYKATEPWSDFGNIVALGSDPIATDGKKWHIRTQVPYIDDRYTTDVFMWVEGDTIVDGISCKKLYKQTRNVKDSSMGTIEVGYCRQEGDKYYQDGKLMFDFGLGVGDMFATSTDNEEAGFFYTVVSIGDTLLLDGLPRKYMVIAPSYEGMTKSNHTDIWVEGIGSLSMGIFENDFYYMDGLKKELQCCSYNGIYIYKKKEESKTYLVTEGKEWAVYYEQSWNQDQPVVTYTFRLQGDTVINGFTYKKKWMSVEKDLSDWSLFPSYMREENGKVYVMNSRGEEALWFDYNAQVGDTLCLTSKQATQQCYGLVTSIDDVVLEHSDGKQRKRYEVVLGQEAMSGGVYFTDECIYIHEDVGMFNSPTYGYGLGDHTLFNYGNKFKLLCVHDNGIALYQSPDGCYKEATSKTYLVTEGKEWAVCSHGFMPPPNHSTYTYRLQGDTIIDGKRYLKEHVSHDIHLANWKPSGRYLREENGKVYSKFKQKNEQIQLDYNMNVGDTLRYNDQTDNYGDYVYICLTGIRDTIMPNGDGVSRRCYDVDAGQYIAGTYHPCEHQTSFVEGIGWIDWGLGKQLLLTDGGWDELLYVKQGNNLLYQKEKGVWWVGDNVDHRPLKQRGYGLYHSDSYLYAYTINEAEAVTDSTDFARWYDKTVIYFDVDTIGPNAFSGATFRQGQILYFTERLNTIFKDAFTDINIIKRTSQESLMSDDLTLVFAGANPPGIDKNHIMDYADSTYHINYVVPDLAAYIEDDIQWTYTTLMTIDDFVQGYVSPENEVTVNDSTETDVSLQPGTNQNGNIDLVVHARPRKEIPVRIGEGENKDIYSRAPAWMRYTMELRITDSEGTELYTGEMQCSAYGECQFNVSFACPANKIIHIYSRSIDMFGRATEWAITTINLDTSISPIVAPNTDAPYYDLQGRPVANPTRGIYIRNGRKVVM